MRDVHITGVFVLPSGAEPASFRFAHKPPRLARMDRLCALALCAADGAMADAGLVGAGASGIEGDRFGVVVGTRFGCHATNEAYYRTILADGVRAASPRLFAYTLPSSPLGEVSIHFGARGAAETVASGRHAGLEAVLRAARLCEAGRAEVMLAIAVEVGGGTLPGLGLDVKDGAVAFVVERASARSRRARVFGGATRFAASAPSLSLEAARNGVRPSHLTLTPIPVATGDGAVDAPAALAAWIGAGLAAGAAGLVEVADAGGGAAALVVGG